MINVKRTIQRGYGEGEPFTITLPYSELGPAHWLIRKMTNSAGFTGHMPISTINCPQKRKLPRMDLILLSFALNEMPATQEKALDFWLRRLHPRGVLLVLEPFSKDSISHLNRYRDRLVQETNYRILSPGTPLPDYPMLQKDDCEYVREWQLPQSLRLLNHNLRRSIEVLKFCFLAIGSPGEIPLPPGASHFRLVAPFLQVKGKWLAAGYASDGVRREYEILSRHLTPALKRELHSLQAGDIVRALNVHPAGNNFRFTLDDP